MFFTYNRQLPIRQLSLINNAYSKRLILVQYSKSQLHIILVMQKIECMGCQTSFRDNERLILQNLTTQYKNFHLPLKDDKAKWTILKTIVSFLNSQGGTIYIGIEDSQGAVQGVFLERKQMDNFKLFMKHLIQKIYPKVDLINKQQVVIQFVPVLKEHQFQGKYVVKIIVQQGDPSQVYFFGEKIKLEGTNNKIDQFQIFYAYERHNMGGTTEIKGIKLLEAIHLRAKTPNKIGNTFHEGCNPQPPHLQLQIRKIHFGNTSKQQLKILQATFKQQFQKLDIEYESEYLRDERSICLTLQEEGDYKIIQTFLVENIEYLNNQVFKGDNVNFEIRGQKNHYFLIYNSPNAKKPAKQEKPAKRQEQEKQVKGQQKNYSNSKGKQEVQKPKQEIERPKKEQQKQVQIPKVLNETPKKNFTKRYSYTFTHIEPRAVNQLQSYLNNSICRNYEKQIVRYINTVEVFLSSQQEFQSYVVTAHQRQDKLNAYGFKGELRMGKNVGNLRICNYDKNKRNNMAEELLLLMGNQIKQLNFVKDERNTYSLLCQMKDKSGACEWLDKLLQGRNLAKFGNSGSDKKNSRVYKLKIYLDLQALVQ